MSSKLEQLLTELNKRMTRIEAATSDVMNTEAAARFLGISVSTLNKITSPTNMLIPTAKIGGKKKVFLRKDLIAYVEKHKQEAIAA